MEPVEVIAVKEAARIIHKAPEYIRKGLQEGRLPFGTAVKINTRWNYNIIKSKFLEYAGIEEDTDLSDLGYVSKLQTPYYVAYKVPQELFRAKMCRKAKCDLCDKEVDKIWFVANNGDTYCEECLRIFDSTLDTPMDIAEISRKVAHYDRLFRA